MKLYLRLTFLTAVFFGGSVALAQTIYKLEQPDGRTVYSDKVLPDAKVKKEIAPESELSIVAPVAGSAEASKTNDRLNTQIARRDELWRARNSALVDLQNARSAKANGEEPLPGERTANARGGARLNDAYWARQDRLQRDIERAQSNLERAEHNLREAGS